MDLADSIIMALEVNFSLPMDLKEEVKAIQSGGGLSGLEAELQHLKDLRRAYQDLLLQTQELVREEADRDAELRIQFGTRWTRPDSRTMIKNLRDGLNRFAADLKQTTDRYDRIERAVKDNSVLMEILDHKPIESALPSLARYIVSVGALNLAQNDEFAAAFNVEDYKVLCYKQIADAVGKYRDIKDSIEEELNIFSTLQDAMTTMRQQCCDFVSTRIQIPAYPS